MVRKPDPEKREQFLNSALKLFVANGAQNTATAAIAKDAGTAAGTLFLYFPTKQALIDELVLKIGREQSETITQLLDPAQSAQETFATIWHGSVSWFLENRAAFEFIQQVRYSRLVADAVVQQSNQYFTYYYGAIQKGLTEGSLKAYPLELIGEMLYRAVVAVINLVGVQPDRAKQEEYIQSGFEIFWNGIKQ